MKPDEPFRLTNDKPKPSPWKPEANPCRQRMLLSGLDCLPGQGDLFPTDGGQEEPKSD